MSSRLLPHLAWSLAVVIAFVAGYLGHDGSSLPAVGQSTSAKAGLPVSDQGTAAGESTPAIRTRTVAEHEQTGDGILAQTFAVLSSGDRLERMRGVCDLLPTITAENWRDALDAIARQARTEGRIYNNLPEYHMVLERIGEVAGVTPLNEALESKKSTAAEDVSFLLKGVARMDPRAAIAWYQGLPADRQSGLTDEIIYAVAGVNPAMSLDLAFQTEKATQDRVIPSAISAAIQQGGFRGAEELLATVSARNDISDDSKGMAFISLAWREIQVKGDTGKPMETLDWFEPYAGRSFVGPNATRELVTNAAQNDPARTMIWLEKHGASLTAKQQEAAYPAMAVAWKNKNPGEFSSWLVSHSSDPRHDTMASSAVMDHLRNGKIDEAEALTQQVTDPDQRAKLEKALAEAKQSVAQQ